MTDALRTCQQRIVELYGIHVEVAFDLLEPLERVAGGRLQSQHFQSPLVLISLKRLIMVVSLCR